MTQEPAPEITSLPNQQSISTPEPSLWAEWRSMAGDTLPISRLAIAGWLLSALWVAFCFSYVVNTMGFGELLQLPPNQLGEFLIGIVAVPALMWMGVGHWQRLNTFKKTTDSLREQLALLAAPHEQNKRFDTVLGALRRQADLFTDASQIATASLRAARGALRQETSLLQSATGEAVASITSETRQVRDLAQEASNQIGQLDKALAGSTDRLQSAQAQIVSGREALAQTTEQSLLHFDEAKLRLNEQLQMIAATNTALRSSREEVEATFASVRHSGIAVGQEMGALGDRASGLGIHLDGLRTAVTAGVNDVLAQTDRLQRRSETIGDTLTEQGRHIERVLGGAGDIVTSLKTSGILVKETAAAMNDSVSAFTESVSKATTDVYSREEILASGARQSLAALRETMAGIDDIIQRSEIAVGGLDRKAGEISFAVATSLNRITDLTGGLAQSGEVIARNSLDATNRIEASTAGLATQAARVQGINAGLADIAGQATASIEKVALAGNEIENALARLEEKARQSHHEITTLGSAITERGAQIDTAIDHFDKTIQQKNMVLEGHISRMDEAGDGIRRLSGMTDALMGRVGEVTEKSQAVFATIGQEVEAKAAMVDGMLARNASRVEQVQQDIMHTAGLVDGSTERTVNRAGDIERIVSESMARVGTLHHELVTLGEGIERTSGINAERLSSLAATMREEFSDVRENANRALERLEKVVASIAIASTTAGSSSDAAEQRLSEALSLMQKNGQVFNETIDTAMAGIHRAERALAEEQENLGRTAEAAAIRFSRLGQELANNSLDLSQTVAESVERLTGISTTADDKITSISAHVSQAQSVVGTYLETVETLAERSNGITTLLQTQSEAMAGNIASLGSTVNDIQEKAREAVRTVTIETAELSANADKAKNSINGIVEKLRDQSRVLSETEADSRALAGRATTLLGEKALELANAARMAATEATVLREADAKVRRDIFLNAAKTVLDGLQSLSVDLVRVLDKDVPEKAWKGLTRNDMPGFTKRLVALRDSVPDIEIKRKFLSDGTFRTHVQTYMHQFEELLEQAMANDQGDILSSTLMSSDIGKIYYYLSAAVGRDRSALQRAG